MFAKPFPCAEVTNATGVYSHEDTVSRTNVILSGVNSARRGVEYAWWDSR